MKIKSIVDDLFFAVFRAVFSYLSLKMAAFLDSTKICGKESNF